MNSRSAIFGIVRALVLAVSGVLLGAGSPAYAATFSGPYEIKSVIVGGYGVHVEVVPTPAGCTSSWEGTQIVVLREYVLFKELLAGVLSAQAQGKPIMVWHDPQGNGTCGFGNQKIVNTIQIKGP